MLHDPLVLEAVDRAIQRLRLLQRLRTQRTGRRNRLRYITQAKARPPTFVLFASRPEELPESYVRYLVNGLRDAFDLPGVPLRLHPRKGDNPYADGR